MTPKSKAALWSVAVAGGLAVIKLAVALFTMSLAVLASALDSLMDTLSTAIAFIAVRTADKPADGKHPFGHGKAEGIAGLFQATFIALSAGYLIYTSFVRIMHGYELQSEVVGLAAIVVSLVASIFLARHLKRVSRETESTALAAGALNFGADIWTNLGVLVALALERWAAVKNADPIISILISIYIVISAVRIGIDAINQLMDRTLPDEMLMIIDACIRTREPFVKGYHNLRTRRVGDERYIEFHVEIDRTLSFEKAHDVTEGIIHEIRETIPRAKITVHTDPA